MIFIDSNVPMYIVGRSHPAKIRGQRLLADLLGGQDRLVTSAEVFQEIVHRYTAVRRPPTLVAAWSLLRDGTDEVFPVEYEDVDRSREVLEANDGLSARDALHVAIMNRYGVTRILSFDTGFDQVEGIVRLA